MNRYILSDYANIFNSYLQNLIPYNNKYEFNRFMVRSYIIHSVLRGDLKRLAAILTPEIEVYTSNKDIENFINKVNEELRLSNLFYEIIKTALKIPQVVVLYLPKQKIQMQCPSCGHIFDINTQNYEYEFRLVSTASDNKFYNQLRADMRIPTVEKKLLEHPIGVSCTCPHCGTEFVAEPIVKNENGLGKFVILDSNAVSVYDNDAGEKYVLVDPNLYETNIALNVPLTYRDIENVPWGFVTALADKSHIFEISNREFVFIFELEEIRGFGKPKYVSPLSGALVDILHTDIMRLGLEALSLAHIDPLYILSPADSTQSSFGDIVPDDMFSDFIIESVKAHEEGDIGRLIYAPMPVNSQPLFGDSKRFITANELFLFFQNISNALGLPPQVYQNGLGYIVQDPLMLKVMNIIYFNKLLPEFRRMIEFLLKQYNPIFLNQAKANNEKVFGFKTLSVIDGSMNDQLRDMLFQNGMLDKSYILKKLGLGTYEEMLDRVNNERLIEMRKQFELQKAQEKIMQQQQVEVQQQGKQIDLSLATQMIEQIAEGELQQIAQMDDGQRRSYFDRLQKENPVIYAVVVKKWEQYQYQAKVDAYYAQQNNNEGGM